MPVGFWMTLKKPFFSLAPMADVTDAAFRRIIAKYGKPDVIWSEFISADGLASEGKEALARDLWYEESEHPIVAQIFGSNPKNIESAASYIASLGFDGVDINMGCPDRNIEKQGAGAALMKNPSLAREIIAAAKQGAGEIPVSVKTRIGYNKIELSSWLPELLKEKPALVTIHARTRKELSKTPARWEFVKEAVSIAKDSGVLIAGNGDVLSCEDGTRKAQESGADGVMIGRAIFGNPWLFSGISSNLEIPIQERFRVMLEHTSLFKDIFGETKNFCIMKKHFKAYVGGFHGAKELRIALMNTETVEEIENIIEYFYKENGIA